MAKSYVSNIKIDSLPLWKGEATIDDIELNHSSINQILEESNSRLRIERVATSRLKAKIPVLSAGKNPISISIHSLDLGAAMVERKEPKEEEKQHVQTSQETQPSNEEQEKKNQQNSPSFVAKLTSNIEIIIDGLSLGLNIKGLSVRLVVSNLYIHIDKGKTYVKCSNIRGLAKNTETSLSLLIEKVEVNASEEETVIENENLTITFSNPVFFDLIKELSVSIIINNINNEIIVRSKSQVKLAVSLNIIAPIIDIISAFSAPPINKPFIPLPDFNIKVDGIFLLVQCTEALAVELSINILRLRHNEFELRPLEMRLLIRSGTIPILEPIVIHGSLIQINRTIKISTTIEILKLAIPISKDLVDQISNIKLEIPPLPQYPLPPKTKLQEKYIYLKDASIVSTQGKIISWEFPSDIIPIGFSFGGIFSVGDKIMLRVYDTSCFSFIPFSSFEITKLEDDFSLDEPQMIPLSKFQLYLPKNVSEYPDLLSKLKFSYLDSDVLSEGLALNIHIKQILVTMESLELPAAAISITNIKANAMIGPLDVVRCNAQLGLSVMLTNLRNQTMCSIVDVPSVSLSLSQIPELTGYIPTDLVIKRSASVLQTNISANTLSASLKIPSIILNVVPTIYADTLRFMTNFDYVSAIAYKVVNESDTSFVFQASTSAALIEVLPSNEKVITFSKGQVHFIYFPNLSMKIMLNQVGFYHISETNYIAVEIIGPFMFQISLRSSTQFHNFLMSPIQINIKAEDITNPITKEVDVDSIGTSSQLLDKSFTLNLKIVGITSQSNDVELTPLSHHEPQFLTCEVLNMLPQIYLCAPVFCCWIVFREYEVDCINNSKHRIQEFSFIPVLVVKNRLNTHVVTSAGVIPPNSSKYISQLIDQSIVFDTGVSLKIGFPLARGVRQRLMIMGQPALVETSPETNAIIISPNYMLYNGTAFVLFFRVNREEPIEVAPNKTLYLENAINPSSVYIGLSYRNNVSWSSAFSIPQKKEVSISTKNGKLMVIIDFTESRACVYPMYIAINESKDSIWLNASTEMAPGTQAQLLLWKGRRHLISFSFSQDQCYSKPVDLDSNEYLIRTFVGSFPGVTSSTYITYSIQSKSEPHTIVFHHDNAPPMTIDNQTPFSFDVICGQLNVKVTAQSVSLLPEIPDLLVFNRASAGSFVLHLSAPFSESIITSMSIRINARVETRATQSRVTLATAPLLPIPVYPRINASLYIADIKINIYNDILEPGIPKMALCITISPISVEAFFQENNNISLSLMLDTLQIDSLSGYENFPVIFSKMDPNSKLPLININTKLCFTLNGGMYIDFLNVAIAPCSLNIEETLIRNVLNILALFPIEESEEIKAEETKTLAPRFFHIVQIADTSIYLSLSTQTLLHTNFRNIPINLSLLHLEDLETFDVSLIQTIIAHYASDILAAAPSIFTSLSWLGSPENLVKQSLYGIKGFADSWMEGGTIFGSLTKGSLSLVRGISIGALESIVSFSSSLQRSIAQISPFRPNDEEIAQRIAELVEFPVQGYQTHGILGIFLGAAKTVVGLITGPTNAFFSLVNKTGEAILQHVNPEEKESDKRIEKVPKELPSIVFE